MKTAISIPDDVFQEAERAAAHLGWSRSRLYAHALRQYLEQQEADPVTAALDAIADQLNDAEAPSAGRALIDAGAWEW